MGVVSLMFSYYKATCGINVNSFPWKIIWCQAPQEGVLCVNISLG